MISFLPICLLTCFQVELPGGLVLVQKARKKSRLNLEACLTGTKLIGLLLMVDRHSREAFGYAAQHLHGACFILLHGQLLFSIGRSDDFFLADLFSAWQGHQEAQPGSTSASKSARKKSSDLPIEKRSLPNSACFSSWLFVLAELVSTNTIQAA
jgi:hypothetical protein